MFKKIITNLLIKKLDFTSIKEQDRIRSCVKMKDPLIQQYLKSRLTNNSIYKIYAPAETQERIRGRIEEVLDILSAIDKSEQDSLQIEKRVQQERHLERSSSINRIIKKFIKVGDKPNKQK